MTRAMRCHDFCPGREADAGNIANIAKEGDKVMGKNSCQPEGLQPQRRLTLSGGLLIFAI
jgi:hypothetical protein